MTPNRSTNSIHPHRTQWMQQWAFIPSNNRLATMSSQQINPSYGDTHNNNPSITMYLHKNSFGLRPRQDLNFNQTGPFVLWSLITHSSDGISGIQSLTATVDKGPDISISPRVAGCFHIIYNFSEWALQPNKGDTRIPRAAQLINRLPPESSSSRWMQCQQAVVGGVLYQELALI